ncbi:MAG: transcription termination factor NusA [Thermoguttaceae bacterium]
MNPNEVLRIVDAIHRDKRIDKEIVFAGVEAAISTAAKKQYGEEAVIEVSINRQTGEVTASANGSPLTPEEIAERIGAQSAKQVMIQKIREAERDAIYNEYREMIDQVVVGVVKRHETGATSIELGSSSGNNVEAVIPRAEKIPGEVHRNNDRIRAVVIDVKKSGSRVKVILSRTRPLLVQRLFEQEIPEIVEGIIEIKAIAREPGHRTKIAVYSADQRVDSVGACIGMRGSRIKNITDELATERIDVIPWDDDMQVYIPNALRPAEIEEVILCTMLGKAVVLVRPDQRSLAIGRKGQNVRLASKLCVWDVEIMTRDELEVLVEKAQAGYSAMEGMSDELAERLIGEGFLTFGDLSIIEPSDLMEMGELSEETVDNIIAQAEELAEREEQSDREKRAQRSEQDEEVQEEIQSEDETSSESNIDVESVDEPAVSGEET